MEDSDDQQALAYWKHKYFKTVAELDRLDKEWLSTEKLLVRLIAWLGATASGQDPRLHDLIADIRATVADGADPARLEPLVDRLAGTAYRPDPTGTDPERAASVPAIAEYIGQLLRELLERLHVPHEFDEMIDSIKSRLLEAENVRTWQSIIVEIADMTNSLLEQLQAQKRELEQFLIHVHNRLEDLSELIHHEDTAIRERAESDRSLDEGINEDVHGIRRDIENLLDPQQIKTAVDQRLETITHQLHRFRAEERRRLQEARSRTQQMSAQIRELEDQCTELYAQVEIKTAQAHTDPLTGIPNRLAYEQRMADEFRRWQRSGFALSVALLDLDHFKYINDTYGHLAGDKALHAVAQLLMERIRSIDFIARYGGEEFIALFPGTPVPGALIVVDDLRSRVATAGFHYKQQPIEITLSAGIASFGEHDSIDDTLERVDRILHVAKAEGRNRCATESSPQLAPPT